MKPVKVGPHTYTLAVDDQRADDDFGRTDHKRLTISLGTGQARSQERDTVLHELLHACLFTSNASWGLDDDLEERLVRTLTPTLLGLLRDNPDLLAFLTEDDE